jgi:hypothetical protein
MKAFRAASVIVSLCLLAPAWAEVRLFTVPSQVLNPINSSYEIFDDVAIDGGYIIVLTNNGSGKEAAFLYRRAINTGRFSFQRTLLAVDAPNAGGEVVMRGGIAAVRIGTRVTIFENSGGTYVQGHTAAPLTHPGGLAISGNSLLVGGDGCSYDAVVYQKGADGNWAITGRIDDHQGECHPEGLRVDLNNDYALVNVPHADHATAWRRNGTAMDWVPAGTLNLTSGANAGEFPFVLSRSTAVSPGDYVFNRSGSTWTQTGRALGVDFYNNSAIGSVQVVNRDGILVTQEALFADSDEVQTHLFQETTPGHFENLAITEGTAYSAHVDVSGHTLVVSGDGYNIRAFVGPPYFVLIYDLPEQVSAPTPIVDDFENGRTSDFTFTGGFFTLAKRGSNQVLAQTSPSGLSLAVANDSDWTKDQVVEADIASANNNPSNWIGLVARYVDANNFYYLSVRNDLTFGVYKRVNGIDTLLRQSPWRNTRPVTHVKFTVTASGTMESEINGDVLSDAVDATFTHGRAGVASFQTRADFDNIQLSGTRPVPLLFKEFNYHVNGQDFAQSGGHWQQMQDAQQNNTGFAQLDPKVYALAYIGVPIENQQVDATLRLDSFDSSVTSGWIGLLARYQDPQNFYYVAIRSKNQIQIRKVVNGVTTILAAAPFTAQPGVYHDFSFSVINDQLHLLVDGALVAAAHDGSFTSGQYGMGTYRATATWKSLSVTQP